MRSLFFRLLMLLLVLTWTIPCQAELVDRIVAIVNDEVITLSELDAAVSPYTSQIQTAAYSPEEKQEMLFQVRRDILDRMIDRKLTEQKGKALGVSVSESEVDQRIERIKEEEFLTEEALRKALADEGYTLEEYRKRIKSQLLGIKLINREVKSKVAITEDEIRAYYEDHGSAYTGQKKYHLRTILVRVNSWENRAAKTAAQDKIETIATKLRAGVPFEDLARRYSEDITAESGGDIGWFSIGELTKELRETVRWMEEGQVSPVLETEQGYQILKLEKIEGTTGKTLEEAKDEIQETIYRQMVERKYDDWLKDLRKDAYIKIVQ